MVKWGLMGKSQTVARIRSATPLRCDIFFIHPYFAVAYTIDSFFLEIRRTPAIRGVLAALALIVCAGCANTPADPSDKAAPATDVGRTQAWKDAEAVVAMGKGRLSAIGAGESMLPVYGEGTVLVLSRIDFASLRAGMQVAYVNDAGHQVVHVLVNLDAASGGWRVRGLNNEYDDRVRVTPSNLIGVVYASFAPGDGMK